MLLNSNRQDPDYAAMIAWLDELDDKLGMDELEAEKILEISEFLRKRHTGGVRQHVSADGELARQVAMIVH